MRKLIQGIVDFRRTLTGQKQEDFSRLALGQKPNTLFICCSDSRVAPNVFASTHPGDLFVVRNVGNLIPACGPNDYSEGDESEWAALEFAMLQLKVQDVIVCGHSECGAMQAIWGGREQVKAPHLRSWLKHGEFALAELAAGSPLSPNLAPHNRLSQLNVLQQLEHLKSYQLVQERLSEGTLRLHAWWFNIAEASVYAYEPELGEFCVIDEQEAQRVLSRLKSH